MIAKTYMITQATYLMGSLPIGDDILNRMNEIIVDFVNGRERKIARERWFRTREMGGYGLTDMKIMDLCIKASWVRRWYLNKNIQDYPEVRILKGNRTEPDFINMDEINLEGWKSLGEIMRKWIQYKSLFYKVGRNMLSAKVFNNGIQLDGGGISTVKALGRVREQELEARLKLINLRDCLGEDSMMKSKNEIDVLLGTRTTFVEFFRFRNEIARLKANIEYRSKLSRRLKTVFNSKRKGSRVLRLEIQNEETKEYFEVNINNFPMVRRIVENVEPVDNSVLEIHMGLWGKLFLDPELKNFLFRFVQGRLFTNQVMANFQENQARGCTFCSIHSRIEGILGMNIAEETIMHLFWECVHVNNITIWVGNELVGRRLTAVEYMLGTKCQNRLSTELVTICLHWSKYWIYNRKLCNRMIILREFKTDWEIFINKMLSRQRFRSIVVPVVDV